ncbi:MAG TPA: GNAT family N-acetyltransferase [Candidatus Eisenbacteria bacterium]
MSEDPGVTSPPAPPTRNSLITLREVTQATVRTICALSVSPEQQRFVSPNSVSIAEAHFTPTAWFRAVYADEVPVGFVMLDERPEWDYVYIWRLLIDQRYQKLGFGRRVMQMVEERVTGRAGVTRLELSCVQEPGGPQPFYESLGYRFEGQYESDGEAILIKPIG